MSHGYAIALLTPEQATNVDASLEVLLAPYEECREVPAYQTSCYCVGGVAKQEARENAQRVHGSNAEQQARFATVLESHFGKAGYYDLDQEPRERWDALADAYWAPIRATEQAAFDAHPLKAQPKPECETCAGTGSYATTRNPMARWDWYEVGGRWNDELHGRNVAPVAEVDWTDDVLPRAIITRTPAGWIERGRLGWFGSSDDTMTPAQWREQARDLLALAAKRGDVAVVVDYHI